MCQCLGKTIETKAKPLLAGAERECGVSADVFFFLKDDAPDFPLKEIEERRLESRPHLLCICLPNAARLGRSVNLD